MIESRKLRASYRLSPRFDWRLSVAGVAAALVLSLSAVAVSAAEPVQFTAAGAPRELKGAPGVYEWRFEAKVGPSAYDRIAIHRIAKGPSPPAHPAIVMLYLPGTNMNGEVAIDDARYSLPIYLAANGVDVWAMDYRTHFVPADATEAQLGELKDWTNGLFESDIDAVARFILAQTHRDRIFLAGFSRGVTYEYLYAAMHPAVVKGIVVLDGFLPRHAFARAPSGQVADDLGGPHLTFDKRQHLMEMVIANPDQPAPIPKYKTARENLEHVVYDAKDFGGKGGLANPMGGFSDPVVLAHVLAAYDRWWPAVQNSEDSFSPELLAALKASKIPVLAFSSTNIASDWPSWVEESAHSTSSSDVTVLKFPGAGHLDVLCGTRSEAEVYAPTLAWLRRHQK